MSHPSHIDKSQLQDMFDRIGKNTSWNMEGDMLWGYFFTDTNRSKLKKASDLLQEEGYRFVEIFEAEDEHEVGLGYYFLHIEKVETHNVDSLYATNISFEEFADRHGLDSYDGMDIGPIINKSSK